MGKNDFGDSVDLAKEAKNDMNRRYKSDIYIHSVHLKIWVLVKI